MKNKTFNILFCGIGGQGVLKASEVLGVAALKAGFHVKKSEVHGMAQRGGSVESHLRFGKKIYSPIIMPGEVDYLVCFHADEEKRLRHFLRKDGFSFAPFLEAAHALPDARYLNTFLLGALAAFLPLSVEVWTTSLAEVVPRKIEENRTFFLQGMELSSRYRQK